MEIIAKQRWLGKAQRGRRRHKRGLNHCHTKEKKKNRSGHEGRVRGSQRVGAPTIVVAASNHRGESKSERESDNTCSARE